MKTVAVVCSKGGVGKTLLSVHLAAAWSVTDHPAAVLDLDPQASAANWGDRREEAGDVAPLPVQTAAASRVEPEIRRIRAAGCSHLVIDTGGSLDVAARNAARVADLVLIPCRPAIVDAEAVASTLELVRLAAPDVPALVVLNVVSSNERGADEVEDAIRELGGDVCPVRIGRRIALARAIDEGLTICDTLTDRRAAEEITALHTYVCSHYNL